MDSLEESIYIYRNHRSCRQCQKSMVLKDGHSPNFGNYYLCINCTPKTREQAWELSVKMAEEDKALAEDSQRLRKRIEATHERYKQLNLEKN